MITSYDFLRAMAVARRSYWKKVRNGDKFRWWMGKLIVSETGAMGLFSGPLFWCISPYDVRSNAPDCTDDADWGRVFGGQCMAVDVDAAPATMIKPKPSDENDRKLDEPVKLAFAPTGCTVTVPFLYNHSPAVIPGRMTDDGWDRAIGKIIAGLNKETPLREDEAWPHCPYSPSLMLEAIATRNVKPTAYSAEWMPPDGRCKFFEMFRKNDKGEASRSVEDLRQFGWRWSESHHDHVVLLAKIL